MAQAMSDFCKARLEEGDPSQYRSAIEELLLGSYFLPHWDKTIETTVQDDPDFKKFLENGIKSVDASGFDRLQKEELQPIFKFLYYHQGQKYTAAIHEEFNRFTNTKKSLKDFYKQHKEEVLYKISSKKVLKKVSDYLACSIDEHQNKTEKNNFTPL